MSRQQQMIDVGKRLFAAAEARGDLDLPKSKHERQREKREHEIPFLEGELPSLEDVTNDAIGLGYVLEDMGIELRHNINGAIIEYKQIDANWTERLHEFRDRHWPKSEKLNWTRWSDEVEDRLLSSMEMLYQYEVKKTSTQTTWRPFSMGERRLRHCLSFLAQENSCDPFCEYIESLEQEDEWDRVDRVEGILPHLYDCEDSPIVRWASRYPFVGILQRAYGNLAHNYDAMKIDTVPILYGPQGPGKTAFLGGLFPEYERRSWYLGNFHLDVNKQQMMEAFGGRLLVELEEIKPGRDLERAKAAVTGLFDAGVRPAYGRNVRDQVRLCILYGTANPSTTGVLSNDISGNRRWAVVPCPGFPMGGDSPYANAREAIEPYMAKHRTQFWLEAAHKYRNGIWESANLPREMLLEQHKVNKEYVRRDESLEEIVTSNVRSFENKVRKEKEEAEKAGRTRPVKDWFTLNMITGKTYGDKPIPHGDAHNIKQILDDLGYEYFRPRQGDKRISAYRPKPKIVEGAVNGGADGNSTAPSTPTVEEVEDEQMEIDRILKEEF